MRRILSLGLIGLLLFGLTGCNNENDSRNNEDSSYSEGELSGVTMHVAHDKQEMAQQFDEIFQAFSEETGVKVVPVALGSDAPAKLRALLDGVDAPALFLVKDFGQMQEWIESGILLDLDTVDDGDMQAILSDMPIDLRLSDDGTNNYGIPVSLAGYGYLVDLQMLDDLFGAGNGRLVADKLRTCSYEEFTDFCDAVDRYIETPDAAGLSLGGDTFAFQAVKTGRAEHLSGVFAFAGAEPESYGSRMLNVALNAVLPNAREAADANQEHYGQLQEPLRAYATALDYVSRHVGGMNGPARRGEGLTDRIYFGHDQSIQMLADGSALFLPQVDQAGREIERIDADVFDRVEFIPVKLPLTDDMIVTNKTAREFNSSITVYATDYYAVNARVSEQEQKAATEFLVWLHEARNLQRFAVDSLGFIPWYLGDDLAITNPLSASILSYVEEGRVLGDPYRGAPEGWADERVGRQVMEAFGDKEVWEEDDREAIAGLAVASWKELRDAENGEK